MDEIKIINLSSGEKADELRMRMIDLINEYSKILTGYEMVGVIDVVRQDTHLSIQDMDDEDGEKP